MSKMMDDIENQRDYRRIGKALEHLAETWGDDRPSLSDLANQCGMSEFHFQRVFQRWVGLSPKKFLSVVSLEQAKQALDDQSDLLNASFDAGLSGPGRLHDLFVTYEAMTPGEYKRAAKGLDIRWGWHDGPFGKTLLLATDRGLCGLAFLDARGEAECFRDMAERWPEASLREDPVFTQDYMDRIFAEPESIQQDRGIRLFLKGTEFQVKVWEALMRIQPGNYTTYGSLAERIGMPSRAARAVGTAVGANPISWLIPCHRVIRNSGMLGGYRWGLPRKIAMMGFERSGQGLRLDVAG
ncbi:methylated-DNA--[protein]-cysteine S-methyltransferase [Pacificispira sp.]|uniref:methylated-DNA--[protein]-cysteine S-methyltransferase n=1 Tax=Pacificispira sp. TaxID=2888761 RepID=UPI003B51AA23